MVTKQILLQFGARVRALRQVRCLSQEKLAEKAGLHRTYLGAVERGERNISIININAIAIALSCEPSELLVRRLIRSGAPKKLKKVRTVRNPKTT
jgi:transcriptional regulator with XRE-family HTH domain